MTDLRKLNLNSLCPVFGYPENGVVKMVAFSFVPEMDYNSFIERIETVENMQCDPDCAFSEEYQTLNDFIANVACGQYDAIEAKRIAIQLMRMRLIKFPRHTS